MDFIVRSKSSKSVEEKSIYALENVYFADAAVSSVSLSEKISYSSKSISDEVFSVACT